MTDAYEEDVLTAYETGSLKSVATKAEMTRLKAATRATMLRNRRVCICPYYGWPKMKTSLHGPRLAQESSKDEAWMNEKAKSLLPSVAMPTRFLQTILTVLPVLTAGLYLLGLSWHQGYLAAFGLDDSFFPLTNDKALSTGFLSLVTFTVSSGIYGYAALGAFIIIAIMAAILSSTVRVRAAIAGASAWIGRHRLSLVIPKAADDLLEKSAVLYWYAGGILIILLLFYIMALFSTQNGMKQAGREMIAFQAGKGISAQIFSPQVQDPLVGKLVICSDKHCAVWSAASTTILKHEAIDRIVTRNLSIKGLATDKSASK
jgi:hypothetical protein